MAGECRHCGHPLKRGDAFVITLSGAYLHIGACVQEFVTGVLARPVPTSEPILEEKWEGDFPF